MAVCLLYRHRAARRPRYYRVEIAYDLFDQISVFCEWGIAGGRGRFARQSYANLREASLAADKLRLRALRRGYSRNDRALVVA